MKNRILFIENEPDLSDILRIYLENNYYLTYSPSNSDALHKLESMDNVKLIIYNDTPPKTDGLGFLKTIRKNHYTTPFIILSDDTELKKEAEIIKNTLYMPKHGDIEAILQIIETIIPKEQKERRQFPRVNMGKTLYVKNNSTSEEYTANLENLSIGGMKIKLQDFTRNFNEDNLEISFDDVKITLNKVKTVYSGNDSPDGIVMGVEFNEISDNAFKTIQDIISTIIMDRIISKGSIN